MPSAMEWRNYCDVLRKVVIFLETLDQLVMSFRPDDYNTHGYITFPVEDAKDYEVCKQRKMLWDNFSWFGFERENEERMLQSFGFHDKAELTRKMQEMQTAIGEVDLDTLHEKYPHHTFADVKSTKTGALSELAKYLSNHVSGVVGVGGSLPAQADMCALLRELQMLT